VHCCILWAKQSARHGGPAWQKVTNRTVLYWSMTGTEHHCSYERERERESHIFNLNFCFKTYFSAKYTRKKNHLVCAQSYHNWNIFSFQVIGLVTLLFVKVPRPGDSKVTFSVFESSCHLLLPVSNHSQVEAISLYALPKDTTSELAGLSPY